MRKISLLILIIFLIMNVKAPDSSSKCPYERIWWKESGLIGGGMGLTLLGLYFQDKISPFTELEINNLSKEDVNRFDRGACSNWSPDADKVSTVFVVASTLSPFSLFLSENISKDAGTISTMYLETILLTFGGAGLSKGLTARTRPFAYNPDVSMDRKISGAKARKSFYSGHTALISSSGVFFATVYSDYYPKSKWRHYIWGGIIGSISLVGYLRVKSGMHYPTDVLAGTVMGSLTGYLVPYIHKQNNDTRLTILPIYDTEQLQIIFNYKF